MKQGQKHHLMAGVRIGFGIGLVLVGILTVTQGINRIQVTAKESREGEVEV